jgi:hypothetical protein
MRTPAKRLPAVAIVPLLLLASIVLAASDPADPFDDVLSPFESNAEFDYDDSGDQPWREGESEVPALPMDDQLLPVRLDTMPAGMQAYLSPQRLGYTDEDRVFRFWLIIKSQAGAYNATYEGLRCDVQEYRVYAYGNPRRDPPVQANRNSSWQAVRRHGAANYRWEMLATLFCDEARRPRPLRDVVATLKGHASYMSPSPDSPNY